MLNNAVATACFGGELRMDRMKLGHKLITKMMKKVTAKDVGNETRQMPENIVKFSAKMNRV